jgi:hypothetical protein
MSLIENCQISCITGKQQNTLFNLSKNTLKFHSKLSSVMMVGIKKGFVVKDNRKNHLLIAFLSQHGRGTYEQPAVVLCLSFVYFPCIE